MAGFIERCQRTTGAGSDGDRGAKDDPWGGIQAEAATELAQVSTHSSFEEEGVPTSAGWCDSRDSTIARECENNTQWVQAFPAATDRGVQQDVAARREAGERGGPHRQAGKDKTREVVPQV